ncbi:MAG: hypothetical protein KBD50_02815 [Candidatus Pacebacteria bacterium]|nr:hypothetical protein [Candidatus Paceibacterota bacterium]
MKRILLGLITIVGAASVMYVGVTGAFFSDTETSTGNTFAAGDIDLKIDNESYYNGVANEDTSWELVDLTVQKFFNFLDLKPDDYGEDTISIHVDTNDAYMCADVTLTSNDDNGINEPESLVDQTDGVGNGELANLVNFVWWADDGDNVLETDETPLPGGPLGALGVGQTMSLALADSATNIWTGQGGPVPGDETLYLGKAWCFGNIGTAPITQDGSGTLMSPAGNNNGNEVSGEPEDGGITCDGSALGNESQTDKLTADVTFNAVQARNNPNFLCAEGGACEFDAQVDILAASAKFESPEVTTAQQWDVFDSPVDGWNVEWRDAGTTTFGPQNRPEVAHLELHENVLGPAAEGDQYAELDSDWGGPSDAGTGEPASVSIYRSYATTPGASYTLKYSFAARPNTPAADNNLEVRVEGAVVDTTGTTAGGGGIVWVERTVNFVATDASTELRFTDLGTSNSEGTFLDNVRLYQISCPNGGGDPEETTLTLQKTVINDDLGTADDSDFTLVADGPTDISGVEGAPAVTNAVVLPGNYAISESIAPGYSTSVSCTINGGAPVAGANVSIAEGDNVVCTITNDDNEPVACTVPNVQFADGVVTSSQGVRKNGTAVLAARSNPLAGIGIPQTAGNFYDNPPPADNTFFALGFKNNGTTPGGSITVEFTNNVIVNGPGNDLKVWEVTGGTSYPDEHVKIDVSQDGVNWFTVAADLVRDAQADIASSGLAWAKFVRITDVSPIAPFEATADGFDLDTFSALNCAVPPTQQVQ